MKVLILTAFLVSLYGCNGGSGGGNTADLSGTSVQEIHLGLWSTCVNDANANKSALHSHAISSQSVTF